MVVKSARTTLTVIALLGGGTVVQPLQLNARNADITCFNEGRQPCGLCMPPALYPPG